MNLSDQFPSPAERLFRYVAKTSTNGARPLTGYAVMWAETDVSMLLQDAQFEELAWLAAKVESGEDQNLAAFQHAQDFRKVEFIDGLSL